MTTDFHVFVLLFILLEFLNLLPIRPSTPLEVDLDGLPSRFNGSRPRILKASLGSAAGKRK